MRLCSSVLRSSRCSLVCCCPSFAALAFLPFVLLCTPSYPPYAKPGGARRCLAARLVRFIILRAGAFSLCPVSRPALSSLCCCCCMAVLSVHWAEISLRQHRLTEQLNSPCLIQMHGCPGKTGSILCFSRPINKYHVVPFCAVEDSTPGLPQG